MTYADGFNLRDKSLCKINDLADAIDGLLTQKYQVSSDAGHAIATTSFTTATGMSQAVTVASGEIVIVQAQFLHTITTGGDVVSYRLMRDAAASLCDQQTDDQSVQVSISGIDDPGAGTYTYTLQSRNTTAARTMTSTWRQMTILKFQNDA